MIATHGSALHGTNTSAHVWRPYKRDSTRVFGGHMTEKKTGIFYRKDPAGVVVMLEGETVFEYKTVDDFIRTHVRAVNDMTMREKEAEAKAERIFAAQYMPLQPPDLYSSE